MKLHLLGLPHTVTTPEYSCCAFTGKVLRFAPMMAAQGYEVIHYGNAGATISGCERVDVLDANEFEIYGGATPGDEQYGAKANTGSLIYREFNKQLGPLLAERISPGDTVCLPFGRGHWDALQGDHYHEIAKAYWLETGIGYANAFCDYRVYESAAWMHVQIGRDKPERTPQGRDYWWTIPNYYDPADWRFYKPEEREDYVLFMGRLNSDKGLPILVEIAKRRPDTKFVICGQGDPGPWLASPNIIYHPPIHGPGRDSLMGKARLLLAPTRYVEPFGGVAAEALLCGTPVAASAFGAFPEYITPGVNGHLCRTLAEWLRAVDFHNSPLLSLSPEGIRSQAIDRFSLEACGRKYKRVLEQIADLKEGGWYRV